MVVRIRHATEGDVLWLLPELVEFAKFADTKYSMIPSKESVQVEILTGMIKDHLFLVAEGPTGPMGFVAGLVVPHLFNPEILVCHETFWWVKVEHRGSSAGIRLLDAFTLWCESHGVHWIFFSFQHNTPINERAFTKRGFRIQEYQYLKEVEYGGSDDDHRSGSSGADGGDDSVPGPATEEGQASS